MTKLSNLLQRIETQLGYEYHDPLTREYVLENMTVKELLTRLESMGDESDD